MRVGSGASISESGLYRFVLWRSLQPELVVQAPGVTVTFLMLNPSTADERDTDPTLTKCIRFSERWGFAQLLVVNLFSWRSTDFKALRTAPDPVGRPRGDLEIDRAIVAADRVVLAWGSPSDARVRAMVKARSAEVLHAIGRVVVQRGHDHLSVPEFGHLGVTKDGSPGHPLMIPYRQPFVPVSIAAYMTPPPGAPGPVEETAR